MMDDHEIKEFLNNHTQDDLDNIQSEIKSRKKIANLKEKAEKYFDKYIKRNDFKDTPFDDEFYRIKEKFIEKYTGSWIELNLEAIKECKEELLNSIKESVEYYKEEQFKLIEVLK